MNIRGFHRLFWVVVLLSGRLHAQVVNLSKSEISFFSSAPLEDITAKSVKSTSTLNLETGEVMVKVPIKSFQFKRRLMQEHFNENYLESDRHPNAHFLGKILDEVNLKVPGTYQVRAKGELEIHGVRKEYTAPVNLVVGESQIVARTLFKVRVADHDIKIPRMVINNIAEEVEVNALLTYMLK